MITAKRIGVIGAFLLILSTAGYSGYLLLQAGERNDAYVCTAPPNNVGIFPGGLSSTNVTAYQYANKTGGKVCTGGKWVPCNDFAKTWNKTCKEIITPPTPKPVISIPAEQCQINKDNRTNVTVTFCFDSTNNSEIINMIACLNDSRKCP